MNFGWTQEYIDNHLTLDQARRYFELIEREKNQRTKMVAIAVRNAQHAKENTFKKFMDLLDGKKGIVDIQKMKLSGLPIEEK